MEMYLLGAGLSIGLAGMGVAIGQGIMARQAMEAMGKNPDMTNYFLILTVLGIALVESAAIYGLIVSFQILGLDPETVTSAWRPIAAGLAIWFGGLGAGIGEGILLAGAMDATVRNPAIKGKIMTYMVLFLALIEAIAIYGLIIALQLLG